jgi:hypothetical protein
LLDLSRKESLMRWLYRVVERTVEAWKDAKGWPEVATLALASVLGFLLGLIVGMVVGLMVFVGAVTAQKWLLEVIPNYLILGTTIFVCSIWVVWSWIKIRRRVKRFTGGGP